MTSRPGHEAVTPEPDVWSLYELLGGGGGSGVGRGGGGMGEGVISDRIALALRPGDYLDWVMGVYLSSMVFRRWAIAVWRGSLTYGELRENWNLCMQTRCAGLQSACTAHVN